MRWTRFPVGELKKDQEDLGQELTAFIISLPSRSRLGGRDGRDRRHCSHR